MSEPCVFCEIVAGERPASLVYEDDLAVAFVDLRQFHPGHTLVVPRRHFRDVRELDDTTGAAVMAAVACVARAVSLAFPNEGLSVWHSIGVAAFQEVPHLHFHVHPRMIGDGLLRIYPAAPTTPDAAMRDAYAATIREHLTTGPEGTKTIGMISPSRTLPVQDRLVAGRPRESPDVGGS